MDQALLSPRGGADCIGTTRGVTCGRGSRGCCPREGRGLHPTQLKLYNKAQQKD